MERKSDGSGAFFSNFRPKGIGTVLTLGLTGGFGSGKSAALAAFKRLGAAVFNCDEIARKLTSAGGNYELSRSLVRIFGPGILCGNGSIDRDEISSRVFFDGRLRRRLEAVMHPLIRRKVEEGLNTARARVRVVEAPLLFEAGWKGYFDAVATVRLSLAGSAARLLGAGWPLAEIRRRRAAQLPLKIKCYKSDFILDNEGPHRSLPHQVRKINQACMSIINALRITR